MKLSFTTLGCPDWDLATVIARAREYGYDGVDFRGCAGEMDLWKLPAFSSQLSQTAARLEEAGLEVPCLSSSAKLLVDSEEKGRESRANLIAFARIANELGAPYVRVFGGHCDGPADDRATAEAAARLDDLAREAGAFDVTVLVETHDAWIYTDKLAGLLEAATEPNVGAVWDVNHPFRTAGESPEQSWGHFGRFVRYVHVKDSRPGEDGYCLAGEGDVPLVAVVETLKRGGYDGWLAVEWERQWYPDLEPPEIAFPQYAQYLRPRMTPGE